MDKLKLTAQVVSMLIGTIMICCSQINNSIPLAIYGSTLILQAAIWNLKEEK